MPRPSPDPRLQQRPARRRLVDKALVLARWDTVVAFHDVDPTGIVWHGHYYSYFEQARDVLLRKIEYDYPAMQRGVYVWPMIDTRVRYLRPARYGQAIQVWAGLTEWQYHMRMEYEVRDAGSNERLTSGYTVQCAVLRDGWKVQTRSPDEFLVHLEPYLS